MKNNKYKKGMIKINKEVDAIAMFINDKGNHVIGCATCNESHCCKSNIAIDITHKDAIEIMKVITPVQIDRFRSAKVQKDLTGRYSCPMLSDDGRCEIYEMRPFACSSYMVVNNEPEDCRMAEDSVHFVSHVDIYKQLTKSSKTHLLKDVKVLDMLEAIDASSN